MAAPELGPWEPLSLERTCAAFGGAPFRWWISGGLALELHLGRSWRGHDDTDVAILRRDAPGLAEVLAGWSVAVAAAGQLTPWTGREPRADQHQNNLWCRPNERAPWGLDVTIADGDEEVWVYRRDPRIQVPWADAVLTSASGVPYLAPELQLLYKAMRPRAKDQRDAREVVPELSAARRAWLARVLPGEHPWQRGLSLPPGDW